MKNKSTVTDYKAYIKLMNDEVFNIEKLKFKNLLTVKDLHFSNEKNIV